MAVFTSASAPTFTTTAAGDFQLIVVALHQYGSVPPTAPIYGNGYRTSAPLNVAVPDTGGNYVGQIVGSKIGGSIGAVGATPVSWTCVDVANAAAVQLGWKATGAAPLYPYQNLTINVRSS